MFSESSLQKHPNKNKAANELVKINGAKQVPNLA
jgi:hypothetical protein